MIYVGTSGYSFKDWIGNAYPADLAPSKMLKYYYSVWDFKAVELNFTYYRMPSYKNIASISRQIPGEITFAVKAPGTITHDYWRNDDINSMREDTKKFISALEPIKIEGRLGPLLLQFPNSFKPEEKSFDYLKTTAASFGPDYKLALEFRNKLWAKKEIFQFIKELEAVPVTVDEPPLNSLYPYIPECGKETAYFRFHGRNQDWFTVSGDERYNYDYSDDELRSFTLNVLEFFNKGLDVYVFFNNCHMGNAVHNALRFRELLGGA